MKTIFKWILRLLVFLLVALVLFLVYAYFRIQIAEPKINDSSAFGLKRTVINDSVMVCGNDWIKMTNSGLYEMHLSGSPLELGVKHGLLAKELIAYQETAFVDEIRRMIPSESYLNFLKYFIAWFNRDMHKYIPETSQQEIYGVSQYADPKFNFVAPAYQRILNYHGAHDIGHALQNMNLVACTAFGVWADRSADGQLILGRNFDFFVGEAFAEHKIVAFYQPDQGYNFMSISWGGLTGVVSGMNDAGLSITLNSAKSDMPMTAYTPVSIVARQILQHCATIEEAFEEAKKYKTFVAESFMIGSAKDGKAAIIEKSPEITALYELSGREIIGTNHYQSDTFSLDPLNVENIAESASMYRFNRVKQLLEQEPRLSYKTVAKILRDTKGLDDTDIGLCNEKAINQLIAHHSIIFKPHLGQVWVSTHDFQLGQYICYDLNKAFADSVNYSSIITIDSLTIEADPFIQSKAYDNAKQYRKGVLKITEAINSNAVLSDAYLESFIASNPKFFHVYKVVGDYYISKNKHKKAQQTYLKALKCEFPRQIDQEDIETKLSKLN